MPKQTVCLIRVDRIVDDPFKNARCRCNVGGNPVGFRCARRNQTAGYLSKVMQGLSRAKLVHSRRGLHGKNLYPLHSKFNDAAILVEETIGDTTIAELNDVPKRRKPLCTFPQEKPWRSGSRSTVSPL